MRYIYIYFFTLILVSCSTNSKIEQNNFLDNFAIVIHGGAGNISLTDDEFKKYDSSLQKALEIGYTILENGGDALNAVEMVIMNMEDNQLFNSGRGSVYNTLGQQEMDASIMDGQTLNAGAVAGVNRIKNPIKAARMVMEKSKHLMLSGQGAIIFAKKNGLKLVDSSYFYVKKRYDYWKKVKEQEEQKTGQTQHSPVHWEDSKFGTVGAVALDKKGNIAAGTSTGGITNKKYGRIGDTPIIGAGTYANNKTCGVSCTGVGEFFIRTLAGHEISNLIQYQDMPIDQAGKEVIYNQIEKLGGEGGLIILDSKGNINWTFNTKGMFRAYQKGNGEKVVKIFE